MAKGECPACNTPNEYSEVCCKMCGVRLPWAPSKAELPAKVTPPAPAGNAPQVIPKPRIVACPHCSKTNSLPNNGAGPFTCGICKKTFNLKSAAKASPTKQSQMILWGCFGFLALFVLMPLSCSLFSHGGKPSNESSMEQARIDVAKAQSDMKTLDPNMLLVVSCNTPNNYSTMLRIMVANNFHDLGYQRRLQIAQGFYRIWKVNHAPYAATISIVDLNMNEVGGGVSEHSVWVQKN